ncbi:SusC/RagA family TonB-linked outer membrane protein [Mucilaginibacter limnophilus]|uniref:SusC/RagA family TonB-linked outer membrane protein n=2 Tax=Mucilaginibacter limnophilus TaxID=1932778 RepID=A0A3S2X089_9SPHI|nr:SusC/RagA family TonB-linked outer membrane protein [Mucilaginibacter limnophilus]
MYKNFTAFTCRRQRRIYKLLFVMKLIIFLLTATLLQVSAATYAQKVTLTVKNATIKEVFEKIQSQTQYDFLYNADDLKLARPLSINLKDTPLKQALDECFSGQPLSYTIENTTILITKRPKAPAKEAQRKVITGTVTDSTGLALPGVTVKEKNTQNAVSTDNAGRYSIEVADEGAVLVFSFIGYVNQEVAVTGPGPFNVKLKESNTTLNEVVVVGYGTQTKLSLTGAVNQIKSENIANKPVTNTFQALQGESPNLVIQQSQLNPGSNVVINIRGVGTLGNNDPLIVIDGIVGGNLATLNPNDIASVSVLKDAGSAAIYGSRAANGVLLVTTKSGKMNQKSTVTYNGNYGIQTPRVLVKKVSAWDNAYYKNESLVNSDLPPVYTPEDIQQLREQGNGTWDVEHILKDAPMQSHNLSVNGGGETSSYYVSLGYQNQESNLIGNGGSGADFGYQKYNVRLNQTSVIGKLRTNIILNYTKTRNKTNSVGDNNIFADANRVPLNYSWTDENGNYLTNTVASQYNEYGVLEKGGFNQADNDEIFGNINGQLNITNDLKLTAVVGGTITNNGNFFRRMQVNYLPSGVYGDDRAVLDNNSKSFLLNTQVYADYNKRFAEHSLAVKVGVSNESYNGRGFQLQKTFTDLYLGTPTTGTILDPLNSNNSIAVDQTSLNSLFGRVSYSYKDRYFLESTFRVDASSKFAPGNRTGFFPSVNAGWLASDEEFFKPIENVVNTLKFRATYGVLGNQNVNSFQYQTTYFNYTNAYGFNGSPVGGAGFLLGNPILTWEKAATLNLGVDAGFLNNKLNVSFDYFDKVTRDILQTRYDVPLIFGAGLPDYNVAKVQNRGWEFTLTYNANGRDLKQSFSFNIGDSKNKLQTLTGGATEQIVAQDVFSLIRRVGEPITQYYGYETNGFFQNQEEVNSYPKPAGFTVTPGDVKFVDQNRDGKIDDKDKVVLGNPFPRYTFGFTYRASYKGFDLSLFVQGVGKRDAFLRGELVEPFHYNYGATLYEHQTDYWTPNNPDARYPKLAAIGSASNSYNWRNGSDLYKYDAAYIRLKNVNIGYSLPTSVANKMGMKTLRVSFIGQNLLTFTKLSFIDPETTEFGNNLGTNSASNSARTYPLPVFYGAGVDVTF